MYFARIVNLIQGDPKSFERLQQLIESYKFSSEDAEVPEEKIKEMTQKLHDNLIVQDAFISAHQSYRSLIKTLFGKDGTRSLEKLFALVEAQGTLNKPENILSPSKTQSRPVKIYIDGAFDLIHSGHYNAIRQARALGGHLTMGVNSDETIMANKGPTVLTTAERAKIIRSCKWIDDVVEGTDYELQMDVLEKYDCDFYAHGDDPVFDSNGNDLVKPFKDAGKYKVFKRTEGVSTTDIIGKLLSLYKQPQHQSRSRGNSIDVPLTAEEYAKRIRQTEDITSLSGEKESEVSILHESKFLATTRRIMHFSNNREPKPGDTVVYIAGSFDLLHTGHVDMLQKAKSMGDFLYVGIWDDETVGKVQGSNYPLLSLHERVLMVLANRYADDVIIGAPFVLQKDLIVSLGIKKVVQIGKIDPPILKEQQHIDYARVAKELGLFEMVPCEGLLTVDDIATRIITNRESYMKKFQKKEQSQQKYYESKTYVNETGSEHK